MSDATQELAPGTIVASRYRVEKCVGRGGMGAVYLVRHVNTDERLALKVLHATVLANAMAVERFRREARAPAQIDSDHVVRVTDADTAPELEGAPFLVMEFLKGQDLEHEITEHGALSPKTVVLYLKQAARALDKAHALGIVHRDLKPENLFLATRDDGTPCIKILDFGIAKITGGSAQALQGTGKTETGTITGTPMYMSPEQIRGDNANVTAKTDIWALGLIAFRLLTGGQYWTAETLPMLVAQIAYEPMAPPSTRGLAVGANGASFDEWFAKCCARDAASRFDTAGAAIDALERALGLEPSQRLSQPHFGPTAIAQTAPAMSVGALAPAPGALAKSAAGSLQGASVSMVGAVAPTPPKKKSFALYAVIALVAVAGASGAVALSKKKFFIDEHAGERIDDGHGNDDAERSRDENGIDDAGDRHGSFEHDSASHAAGDRRTLGEISAKRSAFANCGAFADHDHDRHHTSNKFHAHAQ